MFSFLKKVASNILMYKKKKKKILENIFTNQYLISIIGLIVIIGIATPLIKNFNKLRLINNEKEELEGEIRQMENKNSQLKDLINYLESDDFVNEQARLQLNYKAEGEEVVVITNKKEKDLRTKDQNTNLMYNNRKDGLTNNRSNPTKWWNYFFNK